MAETMTQNSKQHVLHAADLGMRQWEEVCEASGVLNAWIGNQINGQIIVKRARSPAFVLKHSVSKPDYKVDDDSYIESQRTSKRIESELSSKAFSEWSVQTSLAGGAYGLTLGLSGDIGRRKEITSASSQGSEVVKIHCSYNFPRVILTFDERTLTLSTQCVNALKKLQQSNFDGLHDDGLRHFFEEFGGIFACEVSLGGRLYSTESLRNASEAQLHSRKNDMKRALTAKFMGPFVGAGMEWGQTKGDENSRTTAWSSSYQGVSIEAHGGNSLLSWSPQQWAASVEDYHYWRVIKQDRVVELIPYLSEKFINVEIEGRNYSETIQKLMDAYQRNQNATNEAAESVLAVEVGHEFRQLATYERISTNPMRWTFWVSLSQPAIVEEVKIELHKTFNPRIITFSQHGSEKVREKMSITRDGWGSFQISVKIKLVNFVGWRDNGDHSMLQHTPLEMVWDLYLDYTRPEGTRSAVTKWTVGRG